MSPPPEAGTMVPMPAIVSCLTNSYGRFGARAAIERLGEAGLSCIELPIRTAGVPSFFGDEPLVTTESTPADLDNVDRLLERHGVRVTSCNITSGNPLDPQVVEITNRKLDLASHFGVKLVVAGAGEVEDRAQLPQLYAHLRAIGDHAAERGITYCFETHPGICQHPDGMLETMQALDHPHLQINFDTANLLYYNENVEVEAALAAVAQYVRHVHLKDSRGKYREWYFPALGAGGAVDFTHVRESLEAVGFQGPYSLEIEGIDGEPPLTLEQHHQRIKDSVEHLRTCGYFD